MQDYEEEYTGPEVKPLAQDITPELMAERIRYWWGNPHFHLEKELADFLKGHELGFSLDCGAGELTTLDQLVGYINQLELKLDEAALYKQRLNTLARYVRGCVKSLAFLNDTMILSVLNSEFEELDKLTESLAKD